MGVVRGMFVVDVCMWFFLDVVGVVRIVVVLVYVFCIGSGF